jgi:hypothetical protein
MLRCAAFALAAVWLSGCQSCAPVDEGRYQCNPDLLAANEPADSPQCPGASRCGLEGYCHDFGDVSVAWRCKDRNNCENGYECGLAPDRVSRECHNPTEPDAGFPCEADTDCVRSWHCGLGKICHDPAIAAAYACAVDSDCEGGWRCGLEGQCLDPAVDALRGVSTTLGAAEKVNPLLLDHAPELFAVSPVQSPVFNVPRQFLAYYDQCGLTVLDLAVGSTPPIGTNPHRIQTLADAGAVTSIASLGSSSLDPFGDVDLGSWTYVTRPDGGFDELHFRNVVNNFGFDGTPYRAVTDINTGSFVPVDNAPDELRVGTTEEGYVPTLTAYSGRPFAPGDLGSYWYGWGARSRGSFYQFGPGYNSDYAGFGSDWAFANNRVVDLATLSAHRLNDLAVTDQMDCSVMADTRGLFVQQHEFARGTGFKRFIPRPLRAPPFSNQSCSADTGVPQSHRITGLSSLGRDWVGVSAHPFDGGVEQTGDDQVALLNVSNWWDVLAPNDLYYPFRGCVSTFNARCAPFATSQGLELPVTATTVLGPCRVCAGGRLISLSVLPAASAANAKLEVRCRAGGEDGGITTDSVSEISQGPAQGTSCLRTALELNSSLGFDSVRVSTTNSGQLAFAGPRGHLWVGRSSATAVPVFFDEAPTGALSDAKGAPVFIGPGRIGWYAGAPFGILAFPLYPQDGDRPVAVVDGDAKAMITGGRSVVTLAGVVEGESPRVLAAADGTPTRFEPPYLAVDARRPDGGSTVIVSAGDVVLTANLQLAKPVLQRRLVPSEGKEILSLLALPKSGPGPLVTAFALTSNALFKITAETDQLWTAVQAPLPPGSPLELWADKERGRIGYSDGRVFSLETRVQIGQTLNKRVDDYSQSCGQAYALAEGSLFRLVPDPNGGAVGRWQPVGLAGGLPAAELEEGKMMPFVEADGGTTLYLFSKRGEAVRMAVGCP